MTNFRKKEGQITEKRKQKRVFRVVFSYLKNTCLGCVLKVLLRGWYPAWNTSGPPGGLNWFYYILSKASDLHCQQVIFSKSQVKSQVMDSKSKSSPKSMWEVASQVTKMATRVQVTWLKSTYLVDSWWSSVSRQQIPQKICSSLPKVLIILRWNTKHADFWFEGGTE